MTSLIGIVDRPLLTSEMQSYVSQPHGNALNCRWPGLLPDAINCENKHQLKYKQNVTIHSSESNTNHELNMANFHQLLS